MDDVSVMEYFGQFEKAVCLGLYIHHLKLWQPNVLAPLYLEGLINVFLAAFTKAMPEQYRPCMIWVAVLTAKIRDTRILASKTSQKLYSDIGGMRQDERDLKDLTKLLRSFFWDEAIPKVVASDIAKL